MIASVPIHEAVRAIDHHYHADPPRIDVCRRHIHKTDCSVHYDITIQNSNTGVWEPGGRETWRVAVYRQDGRLVMREVPYSADINLRGVES